MPLYQDRATLVRVRIRPQLGYGSVAPGTTCQGPSAALNRTGTAFGSPPNGFHATPSRGAKSSFDGFLKKSLPGVTPFGPDSRSATLRSPATRPCVSYGTVKKS